MTHNDFLAQAQGFLCVGDEQDRRVRIEATVYVQLRAGEYKRGEVVYQRRMIRPAHLSGLQIQLYLFDGSSCSYIASNMKIIAR